MLINIVVLQAPQNLLISIIKSIGTITPRVVIVQTLHHKFFLKVENSEKMVLGAMTKMEPQDLGSMQMDLKDIWYIAVERQ
jgi:hypothetical protein